MIRSVLFMAAYYLLSVIYVLISLPFLTWPGRGPVAGIIKSYTRAMKHALHWIGGIKAVTRGKDRLPEGAFILAGKHQSWGDGYIVYPEVSNLAFVTGDHLEKFPLVGGILRKLGAIVIDTCGGGERKASSLAAGMKQAKEEGRRVLIYPEGHLAPVDHMFRYKSGVWHMQKAMDVPVVPVATNIGLFWPQEDFRKNPGTATIEFLEPIPAGLPKAEFIARLEAEMEAGTARLVAEARGTTLVEAILLPDPDKGSIAKPLCDGAQTACPDKV